MATLSKIESIPELMIEEPNMNHVRESYLRQVANGRPFTASRKNKSAVAGSTAKIYRQKGTGRARQGERTNPHFRGGGLAFPPMPHSQNKKLNKITRRSALRSAVLAHIQSGSAWQISGADFDALGKTKEVALLLSAVNPTRKICLVVSGGTPSQRSSRNLARVRLITPERLNVGMLVETHELVFAASALDSFKEILSLQNNPEEAVAEAAGE